MISQDREDYQTPQDSGKISGVMAERTGQFPWANPPPPNLQAAKMPAFEAARRGVNDFKSRGLSDGLKIRGPPISPDTYHKPSRLVAHPGKGRELP